MKNKKKEHVMDRKRKKIMMYINNQLTKQQESLKSQRNSKIKLPIDLNRPSIHLHSIILYM